MARSTEQVFQDHVGAFIRNNLQGVMADYADDAVLMTMEGVSVGKAAIRDYFRNVLSMPNLKLSGTGEQVHGDYLLCTWTGESDVARFPNGVETFVIRDGKIRLQTVWFTMIPK